MGKINFSYFPSYNKYINSETRLTFQRLKNSYWKTRDEIPSKIIWVNIYSSFPLFLDKPPSPLLRLSFEAKHFFFFKQGGSRDCSQNLTQLPNLLPTSLGPWSPLDGAQIYRSVLPPRGAGPGNSGGFSKNGWRDQ